MTPDRELLRQYAENGDEAAFAEVVRRHVDFVHSAALRLAARDAALAQDVTQLVFTDLARKARALSKHPALTGWLHTSARFAATKAIRGEQRRRVREQEAMSMHNDSTEPEKNWAQVWPLLDDAVGRLREQDRTAVLLRFFENKSHREIGEVLGLNENAARQRVERSLEKLRVYFARRGVTVSAALLATAIGANSVQAAPAGLATNVAGLSLAGASQAALSGSLLKTLYLAMKTKIALVAAIIILAAVTSTVVQQNKIDQLQGELAAARNGKSAAGAASTGKKSPSPADLLAQAQSGFDRLLHAVDSQYDRERKIRDFVATLDAKTAKAFLDDLATKPLTPDNYEAFYCLISRWAELDPKAAFAWAGNLNDAKKKNMCLTQIFDAWSAQNPTEALTALGKLPLTRDNLILVGGVINNYAQSDPQAALQALRSMPFGQSFAAYPGLFGVWASQDPSTAATAALNLPASSMRGLALANIAGTWAQQDPSAALAWAKTLPAGPTQNVALGSALHEFANQYPASAADYLTQLNLPANSYRDYLYQTISTTWAQQDPAGLLAWADTNLTGTTFDTAATAALKQMANTDPAAAAAALGNLSDPNVLNETVPNLAFNWGMQDAQGALAWAQSLPADNAALRNSAISNVFSSWSATDPAAAAAYIQQNLATDPAFSTLATQVVNFWGNTDPNAALKWAESLPQGAAQDSAIVAAVSTLAKADPQNALDYAQQLPGANSGTAMASVISTWANQQPAQAAAALQSLPSGGNLDTATANVTKSWLAQDPNAASQWVSTLPQGSARDNAAVQIIASVGKNDPASAYNWAVSIGNVTTQQTQLNNVVTQWAKKDPAAATSAVQSANLTDEQRANLLNTIAKAGAK